MKRTLWLILVLLPLTLFAETKEQRAESPHELRIGVGDPLLLKAFLPLDDPEAGTEYVWFNAYGQPVEEAHETLMNSIAVTYLEKAHNIGHFFVEYQYRINPYIGVGLDADMAFHTRRAILVNGYNEYKGRKTMGSFYMDIIPRVRFTFLHNEYVNLYAGVGVGLSIDYSFYYHTTYYSPLAEITTLGVSIGKNHLFGTVEILNIGANLMALDFSHTQLFTASIGYRF